MSTDYPILELPGDGSLDIHEHSNFFDLIRYPQEVFGQEDDTSFAVLRDLNEDQLFDLGMKILQVASYFNSSDETLQDRIQAKCKELGIY